MTRLAILITAIMGLCAIDIGTVLGQQVPSTGAVPPTITADDMTNVPPAADPTKSPLILEGARVEGSGRDGKPVAYWTYKTPYEFWLTGLTIALMFVAVVALSVMAWRTGLTPEFTRTFVIIVIIFAALFLIAAGYSDVQAAPVYGLLGTVTGYIFGRLTPPAAPPPDVPPAVGNSEPPRAAGHPM